MIYYAMSFYDMLWYDTTFIAEARQEGISILCGGVKPTDPALANGYFIPPTVMIDVPTTSRVWKEEIFGPVLCIREFTTEEEAIREVW